MSLIEMKCIQDKAQERVYAIEMKERYAKQNAERMAMYAANAYDPFANDSSSDDDRDLTVKEKHEKKMLE
jgi:hypothetical protein